MGRNGRDRGGIEPSGLDGRYRYGMGSREMKCRGSHPGASGAKRARQRRNALRTPFLDAGLLALHDLRFIIAGEVANV